MKKERIIWVDILRMFCTLYIVAVWHGGYYYGFGQVQSYRFGSYITVTALATFAFLSGLFVKTEGIKSLRGIRSFFLKKVLRIYPIYFGVLVIYLLCSFGNVTDIIKFLRCACFANIFIGPSLLTIWYLSMLMLFFILTPVISGGGKRQNVTWFLMVYVILYVVRIYILRDMDIRFFMYFPFYWIGTQTSISGVIRQKKRLEQKPILCVALVISLFLLGWGSILIAGLLKNEAIQASYNVLFCATSVPVCIMIAIELDKRMKAEFLCRIIQVFGYSSFMIYAIHRIVLQAVVIKVGIVSVPWFLVEMAGIIVAGYLAQRCYDALLEKIIMKYEEKVCR